MKNYETHDWKFQAEECAGCNGPRLVLKIAHKDGGIDVRINLGARDRAVLCEAVASGDPEGRQKIRDAVRTLRQQRPRRPVEKP